MCFNSVERSVTMIDGQTGRRTDRPNLKSTTSSESGGQY